MITAMRGFILLFLAAVFPATLITAQDEVRERDTRPVRNTFQSVWLMDHQTVMVPIKGTFEMDFQHRFGTWDNGYKDFFGIFAPSNIRIGFDYVPIERLMIGFGLTKQDLIWDVFGKYAILRQGRSGGAPVSVTYYVNAALDTRKENKTNFEEGTDRWSFFHQVMAARKLTESLSIQLNGNVSWFNFKDPVYDDGGNNLGRDRNAHVSAGALARYKITNTTSITAAYEHPFTSHDFIDPEPGVSVGIEFVTSSHAFQIFAGNYQGLIPQYNSSFTQNRFWDNQILLGFNITRLWNF